MLSTLLGNRAIEHIFLFLLIHEKCYATQIHRQLSTPLTPVQKGLQKLENAGILSSYYEGKTRLFHFNALYPLKAELEQMVRKAYELLPPVEKRKFYAAQPNAPETQAMLTPKERQEVLLTCWRRMVEFKWLLIHARMQSRERKETHRKGKGEVSVIREGERTLLFQEQGIWQASDGKEIHFTNTLRWTLDLSSATLTLEHLRYREPVFLFQLQPTASSKLTSIDSHLCGQDAYFGTIHLDPHFLKLSWRIMGPHKNDQIECLYS